MKASVVDFRKKMSSIQKALGRNESVTVFSHGLPIGILTPFKKKKATAKKNAVKDHPFFAMASETCSVHEQLDALRRPRHDF